MEKWLTLHLILEEKDSWRINLIIPVIVYHSNHFQSALCMLRKCNIYMQKLYAICVYALYMSEVRRYIWIYVLRELPALQITERSASVKRSLHLIATSVHSRSHN